MRTVPGPAVPAAGAGSLRAARAGAGISLDFSCTTKGGLFSLGDRHEVTIRCGDMYGDLTGVPSSPPFANRLVVSPESVFDSREDVRLWECCLTLTETKR